MELAEACWPGCGAAKWYKDVDSKSQRANSTWMWSTLSSIGRGDDSSLSNQCWKSELLLFHSVDLYYHLLYICFYLYVGLVVVVWTCELGFLANSLSKEHDLKYFCSESQYQMKNFKPYLNCEGEWYKRNLLKEEDSHLPHLEVGTAGWVVGAEEGSS